MEGKKKPASIKICKKSANIGRIEIALLAIVSSYQVNTVFSRVITLLSNTRNTIDMGRRSDLRPSLKIELDAIRLAAPHHSKTLADVMAA